MVTNDPPEKEDKRLVLLHSDARIKTPPLSSMARVKVGYHLRQLQQGKSLSMPLSRPMPIIGKRCHELRINDDNVTWRMIYRIDDDAILIAHVFKKKTEKTPKRVLSLCETRLAKYDLYKPDVEVDEENDE